MEKQYFESFVEKKEGRMLAVASDDTVDRMGDSLKAEKWDLANYLKNPVLQLSHDYSQPPIGIAKNIEIHGNKLFFEPLFHEITQQAKEVKALFEAGIMKAFSVGFIPAKGENGKYELLEISAVSIPANPNALLVAKSFDAKTIKDVSTWVCKNVNGKPECQKEKATEIELEKMPDALLDRPGRFHDVINFTLPNAENRQKMISIYVGKENIEQKIMEEMVKETKGFSGAHIKELVEFALMIKSEETLSINEALIMSLKKLKEQKDLVEKIRKGENYDEALEKIIEEIEEVKGINKSPKCRKADESEADCRSRKISEMIAEGTEKEQASAIAYKLCAVACEVKATPKEGDECKMDDGMMGEMHPDEEGHMVCMKKKKSIDEKDTAIENLKKELQEVKDKLDEKEKIIGELKGRNAKEVEKVESKVKDKKLILRALQIIAKSSNFAIENIKKTK